MTMILFRLNSPPNLQYLCYINYASNLLKQNQIKSIMSCYFYESSSTFPLKPWPKAREKLSVWIDNNLHLSSSIKRNLIDFLKLLICEVRIWLISHHDFVSKFTIEVIDNICFTPYGIIDKVKTTKKLIKEGKLPIEKCFDLARSYCLEAEIYSLWESMPRSMHRAYVSSLRGISVFNIWIHLLMKNTCLCDSSITYQVINNTSILYKYAFSFAAIDCNEAAVQYFGERIDADCKESYFVRAAEIAASRKANSLCRGINSFPECTKVFMYVFPKLNDENKLYILEKHTYGVLKCFLDDPWKEFFLEISKYVFPFISDKEYIFILREILCCGIIESCTAYDLQIFRDFWKTSPRYFKKLIIKPSAHYKKYAWAVLKDLFAVNDRKSISLILNDAAYY